MATTNDLSALVRPIATRYFADGDAANFCVHTLPGWCRAVTVTNRGTGVLVVQVPGEAGAASATSDGVGLVAGQKQRFIFSPVGKPATTPTIGTWGEDGANHPLDLLVEAHVE